MTFLGRCRKLLRAAMPKRFHFFKQMI